MSKEPKTLLNYMDLIVWCPVLMQLIVCWPANFLKMVFALYNSITRVGMDMATCLVKSKDNVWILTVQVRGLIRDLKQRGLLDETISDLGWRIWSY
jgi:hypothetical protein